MQHFLDTVDTIPAGMGFSYFHPFHLCWLGGIALAIFALCRLYRRSDADRRQRIRRCLALLTVADQLFKDAGLLIGGNFDPSYLPMHLCSINIFLIALHAWKPSKLLENFLYSFCIVPAAALLFPVTWSSLPGANFMVIHSFTVHGLLLCYPILLLSAGELRRDWRYFPAASCFSQALPPWRWRPTRSLTPTSCSSAGPRRATPSTSSRRSWGTTSGAIPS